MFTYGNDFLVHDYVKGDFNASEFSNFCTSFLLLVKISSLSIDLY